MLKQQCYAEATALSLEQAGMLEFIILAGVVISLRLFRTSVEGTSLWVAPYLKLGSF